MKEKFAVLGYDIGGTKIGVGLVANAGKVLGRARLENKDTRPEEVLPQLAETGKRLIAEAGLTREQVWGIGIATPSPADIPNGIVVAPPNNKYWRDVPLRDYLSGELGIEGFMDNDANAGVLAEWFFGAGRGCKNVIYLTMSTGVGGGVVSNGHLVQGASYYAGEVGHMVLEPNGIECNCGLTGCYEAYCGGQAIAQRIQRELANQPEHQIIKFAGGKLADVDMIALEKAVRAEDAYAVNLWNEVCMRNAQAYGILLNLLNPERLILGTIAWAAGDLFMKPTLGHLPKFAWRQTIDACQIVTSELRRDIGYYAGAAVALNNLYETGRIKHI